MTLVVLTICALALFFAVAMHAWRIIDSIMLGSRAGQAVNVSSDTKAILPVLSGIIKKYIQDTSKVDLVEPAAGFGHVSRSLARSHIWRSARAIEISPYSLAVARALNVMRPSSLIFRRGDIFDATFESGSFIYLYVSTEMLERLKPQLKGCLVASLTFEIPSCVPDETIEVRGWQRRINVYDFRGN